MILTEPRLYKNRQDSNKVVVIKEIKGDEVTFFYVPSMNSNIDWFVPPQRETLSLSEFKETYKPFK